MSVLIFLGPTLPIEEARNVLDATYLPPVAHGDVYRATLSRPRPRVVGVIDGYFRHRPAVRHKEILWAMSEGIHLFGAASIGALRAAELREFGMIGVGQIFWEYAEGRLEDDDEVAVDHGPQELGYPPLNETLVDIRATLEHARQQGVIGQDSQLSLIAIAKQSFYPRRQYAELINLARQQGSDSTELDRLRAWLPGGKVSRKREDALAMLGEIRDFLKSGPPSLEVTYHFERTEMWEADIEFAGPLVTTAETADLPRREHLLDEIRLGSIDLAGVRNDALCLVLSKRETERARIAVTEEEVSAFRQRWLSERALLDPDDFAAWSVANHLRASAFDEFIAARARDSKLAAMAGDLVEDFMIDALRMRNEYAALVSRAVDKQRTLQTAGAADVDLAGAEISASELVAWFCGERLQSPAPVDAESLAADLGFHSVDALCKALLREYRYLRLTNLD